jgi:uncharacterized protein YqjF (DUF2071 family)
MFKSAGSCDNSISWGLSLRMTSNFLSAEWRNLIMANYIIDPNILKKHLPCKTELEDYDGSYYVSLVGFLFHNTRVMGVSFPFHNTFEEVNLRFYVRYKEEHTWKRGVVFLKEIVPKRMISFIANSIYGENYVTLPMKHNWNLTPDSFDVGYEWKTNEGWNHIRVASQKDAIDITKGSAEEFITEHYWGYTQINDQCTGIYEVQHPKWRVHPVISYSIKCNTELLYGKEFAEAMTHPPASVFLAEGSPIQVRKGSKVRHVNN